MRNKINIPALFLASLVLVATNGIAVFEHICNTSQTHNFSFFSKPACEMEKPVAPCCVKMGIKKKPGCCEHKQFFSKLSIEGFTAKQIQLKPIGKSLNNYFCLNGFAYTNNMHSSDHLSGLPPPDNLFNIKNLLQPTPEKLQIYRC